MNRKAQRIRRIRAKKKKNKTPFNFKLWVKAWYEATSTSLFFLPALAIIGAIVLGISFVNLDRYLSEKGYTPPVILTISVDSARALLSTVASATISFAGVAFSVSLLVIQLGSSQYSPRIVHTLFKDPFSRRIVAFVVGTFAYALVVMANVDVHGTAIVPNVSVAIAVVLGILSVLLIVAYIDHSAHHMDISKLLERVTRETIKHIEDTWPEEGDKDADDEQTSNKKIDNAVEKGTTEKIDRDDEKTTSDDGKDDEDDAASYNEENEDNPKTPKSKKGEEAHAEEREDCHVVRFRSSGWIQDIDLQSLLKLVPPNGYIKLHTLEGRYAIPGSAVCSVYPKPSIIDRSSVSLNASNREEAEEEEVEDLEGAVLESVLIGPSRTMQRDAPYGLRQLVDVVLRALSPGVNDPTTAQDGIFHITAIVTEFLHRVPPPAVLETDDGGKLILNEQHDYDSIVRLGFNEARICASSSPTVALYILEALRLIRESLKAAGRPGRAPEIERQAKLVVESIEKHPHTEADHESIVKAKHDRFDTDEESPKRGGIAGFF